MSRWLFEVKYIYISILISILIPMYIATCIHFVLYTYFSKFYFVLSKLFIDLSMLGLSHGMRIF